MSSSQRKYFSGSSLDSALMQAARYHGLAPDEVAYRKVEKKHGFLRTRKAVVIEVDPEAPRISAIAKSEPESSASQQSTDGPIHQPPPPAPADPSSEATGAAPAPEPEIETAPEHEKMPVDEMEEDWEPEETDGLEEESAEGSPRAAEGGEANGAALVGAAERGLGDLLDFALLDLEVEVHPGDGELEIELTGPDRGRLIEDRGNLLLSIQHLLPRLIRGREGRSIPCNVDSEGFHASREIELRRLAEEAAAEVRQRHQPRTLPPMNPAERRIIHVTLSEDKDLTTESQGKGFFKRVTISPAMRRPRGFDRYS